MRVYFDNAATTPMDSQVLQAMLPFMQTHFGNPSAIHSFGRETRAAIEKARKTIAKLLNVSPGEIFFTSGGTEADNMAIACSVRDLGVTRIISSVIEHHAVTHTVEMMKLSSGVQIEFVDLMPDGKINYNHLEQLLADSNEKTLVSLMHANNEIGVLLDIEKVSALCNQYNAYFHSDTVQTIAHYKLDLQKIPIHFITAAAHKFHGPKGIGFIYINKEAQIKPMIQGGGQERNMRAGTENLYGIIGMAKAIEIAYDELEETHSYILGLRDYMLQQLQQEIPGILLNSDPEGLYTVLNVNFPPSEKNEMLLFNLDINGIAASGGSACSSGSNVGSHVIAQLHREKNSAAVRFSFSKFNTKEEVDYVIAKLKELVPMSVAAS
ncbi:MAG: cysteine desulfurase [Bacteroidetes bacterium]|nr:cysteine desulfurase [Bacteroidota bacterium]MBP7398595.1 cysteine desulfurase [Chitinophagales bacterium]MBK7109880.1 cysteine desulfurase [Bacteroidota bacterium]MBK8487385.1 cysteine desulfurase [Bacteroidota bacterium]MBK8682873.1 cysteine desulfurase [Bacteroidota bacterium]